MSLEQEWFIIELVAQLSIRLSNLPCWIACHDGKRFNFFRNHCPKSKNGPVADV